MKKVFAFILLISLFLSFTGYHLFFRMRRQELKSSMKEFLRSSGRNKDLETFTLPLNDEGLVTGLVWEGDDEFRMNGKMYDVVEKRIENGSLFIRCIEDQKEALLIKDYEKTNRDDFAGSGSKHNSVQLLKLVQCLYLSPSVSIPGSVDLPAIKYSVFNQPMRFLLTADILTPPPQVS